MLGGCGRWVESVSPFDFGDRSGNAEETIVAGRGDSIYALARRHNVPTRDLIEANNLKPPYVLEAGQKLVLPHVRAYTVQKGDSIYAISRSFNVDSNELVRTNGLQPPYAIRVGQVLRLPDREGRSNLSNLSDDATVAAALPSPIRKPDSQDSANSLTPNNAALPTPPPLPARSTGGRKPGDQRPSNTRLAVEEDPSTPASHSLARPKPSRGGMRFMWPVRGKTISDFGNKPDGLHNDGVNVAAPRGTPVLASENGVVVYAGNELRGYGNLLLLRHQNGWMTAYAHLDQISVEKGAQVQRGQAVATVGATGTVATPQLHFEIRKGNQAVNPADYLTSGAQMSALSSQ
ncbi:lipoprotein NlpD [Azospirillaceae bacterium]